MFHKIKKIKIRMISLLLVCILLGNSMIIYGNEDVSVGGADTTPPPPGGGSTWAPDPNAARFVKTWQGYRFYAAVAYRNIMTGNYDYADIIQTKYGTDCIDLIGSGFEQHPLVGVNEQGHRDIRVGTSTWGKIRPRNIANTNGVGENVTTYFCSFTEFLNTSGIAAARGTDELEYYPMRNGLQAQGSKVKKFILDPYDTKAYSDRQQKYKLNDGTEVLLKVQHLILVNYYDLNLVYKIMNNLDYAPDKPGYMKEVVIFMENTFGYPIKNGDVFYGTVYEYGLGLMRIGDQYDPNGGGTADEIGKLTGALFCEKNLLGISFFPNIVQRKDPYNAIKVHNFEDPDAHSTWNSYKERKFQRLSDPSYDYGVCIYQLTGLPHLTLDSAFPEVPKDPDYDFSNPKAPLKLVNVGSDASIMTGWESTNGLYDIRYSESSGIPASEYLTNNIVAQDSLINVSYDVQTMSPKKYPEVEYNLTYYNECPWGTHKRHPNDNRTEPDYDEYGNVTGSHTVEVPCTHYMSCKEADCKSTTVVHVQAIPRIAAYYFIRDYAVHSLSSVTVSSAATVSYAPSDVLQSNQIDILVSGRKNPFLITQTDPYYHVDWNAVQKKITVTNSDIGQGVFDNIREARKWAQQNGAKDGNDRIGYPTVKNDRFIIDGQDYLNDNIVTGKENTNGSFVTIPQAPNIQFSFKAVQESQDEIIPYNTYNGRYYTNILGIYSKLCGTSNYDDSYIFSWTSSDHDHAYIMQNGNAVADRIHAMRGSNSIRENTTLKNNVTRTFVENDPMMVITPVIAESTLHTPELSDDKKSTMTDKEISEWEDINGNQMPDNRISSAQQVRLDEYYKITFDPYVFHQWVVGGSDALYDSFLEDENETTLGYNKNNDWSDNGNEWYGREGFETDSKYDKYVLQKWIKFPFDVYIDDILFEENTWICVYYYDPDTEETTAGQTKNNHLRNLDFYIPPWATETVGNIELLVYAINEEGINFSKNDALGRIQVIHGNIDGSEVYTYAAYNAINVQSSGWAYDFMNLV